MILLEKIEKINSKLDGVLPRIEDIKSAAKDCEEMAKPLYDVPIVHIVSCGPLKNVKIQDGEMTFDVTSKYFNMPFLRNVKIDNFEEFYEDFVDSHFEFSGILESQEKEEEEMTR